MYDSREVQRRRLAELIERSGMSARQVAIASGVKPDTVYYWLCRGITQARQIDAVRRVARTLGTTASRLLDV